MITEKLAILHDENEALKKKLLEIESIAVDYCSVPKNLNTVELALKSKIHALIELEKKIFEQSNIILRQKQIIDEMKETLEYIKHSKPGECPRGSKDCTCVRDMAYFSLQKIALMKLEE